MKWYWFCDIARCDFPSFAIISLRKREMAALLDFVLALICLSLCAFTLKSLSRGAMGLSETCD